MEQGRIQTTTPTVPRHQLAAVLLAFVLLLVCGFAKNTHSTPTIPDINQFAGHYPGLSSNDVTRQAVQGDVLAQHEPGNRQANGCNGFPANASAAAMWDSNFQSGGV